MAGQPSNPIPAMTTFQPLQTPVVVIGPQFLAQYPVDLKVATKLMSFGESNFGVTDMNGTLIFRVKSKLLSIRDRRHLLDIAGNVIATFQQKIMTAHRRWKVFRGESTNDQDLLFSVKKSSIIQFKTELDVCLAANTAEDVPDFKVRGSWLERSCTIYLGQTNTIIAQMHRKHTLQTVVFDADNFGVTVYPNVDYAFVVALVVILDEINEDRRGAD
ncbi:protein LURP-one-related 15 [Ricinus communis]|uniref:protein LURP-one-related 15 n=1 Tax=Ricinus communis TaxID=3988 RepID=UPI00201A92EE|nr:protein LURP-one-related 15 [Ricinus communis]XP_048236224.1 protein LURP-one-related 15 [Ricinus communis]